MGTAGLSSRLLVDVLKRVSRLFYVSMRVLPKGVREPVSVAYLLARAADTVADSNCWTLNQRTVYLKDMRRALAEKRDDARVFKLLAAEAREGGAVDLKDVGPGAVITPGEVELLRSLPDIVNLLVLEDSSDQKLVREIVCTLIDGMLFDMDSFPGAFTKREETERYTYLVAGCVGEFWTKMLALHTTALRKCSQAEMEKMGVRFGKALQLTNILRDLPKDLQNGRCYLPIRALADCDGSQEQLEALRKQTLVFQDLGRWIIAACDYYESAAIYACNIPFTHVRLRLSLIMPIISGLGTIELLAGSEEWPAGPRLKVRRSYVYCMMIFALIASPFTPLMRLWFLAATKSVRLVVRRRIGKIDPMAVI